MAERTTGERITGEWAAEEWATEEQTPNLRLSLRIKEVLHRETTPYQEMAVYDTFECGRTLFLDGTVQTTAADEFTYHEALIHVPLFAHPNPRRVLIVGGGDGGPVREVLKHPSVEAVHLVEIDRRVFEVAREYLPFNNSWYGDPRAQVIFTDGIRYVADLAGLVENGAAERYDVAIVDSTDPVGPAVGLFTSNFYAAVRRILNPGGLMVAQSESPFVHRHVIKRVVDAMSEAWPVCRLYLGPVPTYPSGYWSYTIGANGGDPSQPARPVPEGFKAKLYTSEWHRAAFALPPFVQELLP